MLRRGGGFFFERLPWGKVGVKMVWRLSLGRGHGAVEFALR